MSERRVFKVGCPTWRHVQVFCDPALRKGRPLAMRLPFEMSVAEVLVVELGLPNELSVDFDSEVVSIRQIDEKRWVAKLRMIGLDDALVGRLGHMMAEEGVVAEELAEPVESLPRADDLDVPPELSAHVTVLRETLRKLRSSGAAEFLGVPKDAPLSDVEAAFQAKMLEVHPDALMPRGSETLVRLGREITMELTISYEALRGLRVEAGRQTFSARSGAYLCHANLDDWHGRSRHDTELGVEQARGIRKEQAVEPSAAAAEPDEVAFSGDPVDEALDDLDAGRIEVARAKLAAAVKADPRNRKVRALYHVAYGRELLERGEAVPATTQFEAALVHDVECERAARALEALRGETQPPPSSLWQRLFGG